MDTDADAELLTDADAELLTDIDTLVIGVDVINVLEEGYPLSDTIPESLAKGVEVK